MVKESLSLEQVAEKVRKKEITNIVFLVGAGISTAAGIPDFRTPGTGLYSNLERLNLPAPEAVFDISFFRKNPKPFYVLADELYPGQFEPTVFHQFMKVAADHDALLRIYTQNIDTLERIAGVPGDKVIEAHGSFAGNHCIDCRTPMSTDDLKRIMREKSGQVTVPRCSKKGCGGYVKPDIVFYGEALPRIFFDNMDEDLEACDLAIVAGTSLTVSPFSQLPDLVGRDSVRILFNMDRVGTLGRRPNDVVLLGDCDANVSKFAELCGWELPGQALSKKDAADDVKEEVGDIIDKIGLLDLEGKIGKKAETAGEALKIEKDVPEKGSSEPKSETSEATE